MNEVGVFYGDFGDIGLRLYEIVNWVLDEGVWFSVDE